MATVLNRTTKQLIRSVNTPDYNPVDWIINPDLTAVEGWPSIYWTITGDVVTLQNQTERDATDAAILATQVTEAKIEAPAPIAVGPDEIGMRLRAIIELFNKRDNYLTSRISELQITLDAVKASSGPVNSIRDAIPSSWMPTNTRPRSEAIQDFRDIISNDEANQGE